MAESVAVVCRDRSEWLTTRRGMVGGSDAPAVLGISKWSNPLKLFVEKRGLVEDKVEAPWMTVGRVIEGAITQLYQEQTGREVIDLGPMTILKDPERPQIGTTLDRLVVDKEKGLGVLEAKNTSLTADWTDEPPAWVQAQHQHELAVVSAICRAQKRPEPEWGSIAVLLGGRDFRYFDVPKNERFIKVLLQVELEFWARVESGDPPPVDGTEHSRDALKVLYPNDDGAEIELPVEAEVWVGILQQAKLGQKTLKDEEDKAGNLLREALGSATFGVLPNGQRISLKTVKKEAYTVKAQSYRTLRVLKEKGE